MVSTAAARGIPRNLAGTIRHGATGCVQFELSHFVSFEVELKSSRGTGVILPRQVTSLVPQHGKPTHPSSI